MFYGIGENDILSDIDKFTKTINEYLLNGLSKISANTEGVTDFSKITREQFLKILEPFKEGDEYNKITQTSQENG